MNVDKSEKGGVRECEEDFLGDFEVLDSWSNDDHPEDVPCEAKVHSATSEKPNLLTHRKPTEGEIEQFIETLKFVHKESCDKVGASESDSKEKPRKEARNRSRTSKSSNERSRSKRSSSLKRESYKSRYRKRYSAKSDTKDQLVKCDGDGSQELKASVSYSRGMIKKTICITSESNSKEEITLSSIDRTPIRDEITDIDETISCSNERVVTISENGEDSFMDFLQRERSPRSSGRSRSRRYTRDFDEEEDLRHILHSRKEKGEGYRSFEERDFKDSMSRHSRSSRSPDSFDDYRLGRRTTQTRYRSKDHWFQESRHSLRREDSRFEKYSDRYRMHERERSLSIHRDRKITDPTKKRPFIEEIMDQLGPLDASHYSRNMNQVPYGYQPTQHQGFYTNPPPAGYEFETVQYNHLGNLHSNSYQYQGGEYNQNQWANQASSFVQESPAFINEPAPQCNIYPETNQHDSFHEWRQKHDNQEKETIRIDSRLKETTPPPPPPPPVLTSRTKISLNQKSNLTRKKREHSPENNESHLSKLLQDRNLSLSDLLEATINPGSEKKPRILQVKKDIIARCEEKITQLYRRRNAAVGCFMPDLTQPADISCRSPLSFWNSANVLSATPTEELMSWRYKNVSCSDWTLSFDFRKSCDIPSFQEKEESKSYTFDIPNSFDQSEIIGTENEYIEENYPSTTNEIKGYMFDIPSAFDESKMIVTENKYIEKDYPSTSNNSSNMISNLESFPYIPIQEKDKCYNFNSHLPRKEYDLSSNATKNMLEELSQNYFTQANNKLNSKNYYNSNLVPVVTPCRKKSRKGNNRQLVPVIDKIPSSELYDINDTILSSPSPQIEIEQYEGIEDDQKTSNIKDKQNADIIDLTSVSDFDLSQTETPTNAFHVILQLRRSIIKFQNEDIDINDIKVCVSQGKSNEGFLIDNGILYLEKGQNGDGNLYIVLPDISKPSILEFISKLVLVKMKYRKLKMLFKEYFSNNDGIVESLVRFVKKFHNLRQLDKWISRRRWTPFSYFIMGGSNLKCQPQIFAESVEIPKQLENCKASSQITSSELPFETKDVSESEENENDKITFENDKIAFENDKITPKNDKITSKNDKIAFENDKITSKNDKIAFENDKITFKNDKITFKNDKITFENAQTIQIIDDLYKAKALKKREKQFAKDLKKLNAAMQEAINNPQNNCYPEDYINKFSGTRNLQVLRELPVKIVKQNITENMFGSNNFIVPSNKRANNHIIEKSNDYSDNRSNDLPTSGYFEVSAVTEILPSRDPLHPESKVLKADKKLQHHNEIFQSTTEKSVHPSRVLPSSEKGCEHSSGELPSQLSFPEKEVEPSDQTAAETSSKVSQNQKNRVGQFGKILKETVLRLQKLDPQLSSLITKLKNNDKDLPKSFALRGGVLCKKFKLTDTSEEMKMVLPNDAVTEIISVVHTISVPHASYDRTLLTLKKFFSPIENIENIVRNCLKECSGCEPDI